MIVIGRQVGGKIFRRTGQCAEFLQNGSLWLVAFAKPFTQPPLFIVGQFFNGRHNFRNRARAWNVANQKPAGNPSPQRLSKRLSRTSKDYFLGFGFGGSGGIGALTDCLICW
jgi:hypothetical protein